MNIKELEALVLKQGDTIETLNTGMNWLRSAVDQLQTQRQQDIEAHMHLVQRADNIVEGFKKELAARDEAFTAYKQAVDEAWIMVKGTMSEFKSFQDGMNDTLFGAVGRIETLEKLVLARNASAPTKRNMTDEDALRVLTGDLKDLSHKDAAEKAGLTYAQVYSCRLEFTFKHVHKDLRDNVEGWKNAWAK